MGSGNLDVLTKMTLVNTPQSPITARVEPRPFYQATLTPRRSLKPFPETISQTGRPKT